MTGSQKLKCQKASLNRKNSCSFIQTVVKKRTETEAPAHLQALITASLHYIPLINFNNKHLGNHASDKWTESLWFRV